MKSKKSRGANSADRASLLFMAGDQIYADDMAESVLKYIQKWTDVLFDWSEPKFKNKVPQAGERQGYMRAMGLTTDKGESHLVSFQEYITMYLLAWSPSLWSVNDIKLDSSDESNSVQKGITFFEESLEKFQKLLANTPTMMLIDDHDVTDDWNIHGQWFSNVWCQQDGALNCFDGARVLSNAYLAGLIFQLAGNGEMDRAYLKELTGLYSRYLKSESFADYDTLALFHEIRDFKGHSFVFSQNEKDHYVILDTRTDRVLEEGTKKAAQLISAKEIERLFTEAKDAERLIVVSPTPIFGFRAVEQFQEKPWFSWLSPAFLDREAWSHNKESFGALLEALKSHNAQEIICLGGDVHYAFADSVEFDGLNKKITALTASPFKTLLQLILLVNGC